MLLKSNGLTESKIKMISLNLYYQLKRRLKFSLILFVFVLILLIYTFSPLLVKEKSRFYEVNHISNSNPNKLKTFRLEIQANRLNNLFRILENKELDFLNLDKALNLPSFDRIKQFLKTNNSNQNDINIGFYQDEIRIYLKLSSNLNNLQVTNQFVEYLTNKSEYYSFNHPRQTLEKYGLKVNFIFFEKKISVLTYLQ